MPLNNDAEFPALDGRHLDLPHLGKPAPSQLSSHSPRILLLYGSPRDRS